MFLSELRAGMLIMMLGIAVAAAPVYALDLHGTYVSLGINSDGSLINDAVTLGAKFPDSPSIEFFIPGSPYEGWAVGVDSAIYLANFAPDNTQIPVTVTDTSAGSIKSALVTGTADFGGGRSLAIRRTIAFSIDGTSVTFRIELTNTGSTTLTRVAFMEGGDPDQGVGIGAGFGTYNDVVFDGQFVRAWASGGVFPSGLTVGLGTCDKRCVLSVESSWTQNPYDVLNSPVDPGDSMGDAEICLAFDFGTLGVGQTVSAEYHMIFGRTVSEADDKFVEICPSDNLVVTPTEGLNSSGLQGGPFTPSAKNYTLTNIGPDSLDWSASATQTWVTVLPASGTLDGGASVDVEVTLNEGANSLVPGIYPDVVTFTNVSSGLIQTRYIELVVNKIILPPAPPHDPVPADGAVEVSLNTLLQWSGGGSPTLQNGGFETGVFTGWTIVTGPGTEYQPWTLATAGSGNWFFNGIPFEGIYFAQNGFDGDAGLFYDIYQEIDVPEGASSAQLEWSERLQWDTTFGAAIERPYEVTIQPAGGGAPLALLFSTTIPPDTTGDTGYVTHSVDLLAAYPPISGQTVRINFHQFIPETYTGPAQFDLDGVSLTITDGTGLKRVGLGQSFNDKASSIVGMSPARFPLKDRSAYQKIKEKALALKTQSNVYASQQLSSTAATNPADAVTLSVGNLAHSVTLDSDEIVIDASDRGWWRNDGYHSASNKNTITGQNGSGTQLFHSFFVFDLSSVPAGSFMNAKLRLEIENYFGPDSSESLTISDVSTPIEILTSSGTNVAVFNDLGSGNSYGNFTVVPADVGSVLEITLNSQAITDIIAATGGFFAVGLKVDDISSPSGDEGVRFSASSEARVHQLVLTAGEETSTNYEVYFGKSGLPMNLIYNGYLTTCPPVPSPMDVETTYTWQVIARNLAGSAPGPVWSFTTIGFGEVVVEDSLPPPDDLNMPFGDVSVSGVRTETLTITNADPVHGLFVTGITLGGFSPALGTSDLSITLPSAGGPSTSSGGSYFSAGSVTPQQTASQIVVQKGYRILGGERADVLLLASGSGVDTLQTGLAAFADINKVDFFDSSGAVPTLSFLSAYDVVVVMSNNYFSNAAQTGDVLADYVDNGGKVIEAVACYDTTGGWQLVGRFVTGDYESFNHGIAERFDHSLGDFDDKHPIMAGVAALTCSLPVGVTLKPLADWVANWNNGTPLVATRNDNVVGINIFPYDGFFTGDVVLLFHNAVVWLVEGGTAGFSLTNDPCLPAVIPPLGHIDINVTFAPTKVDEYKSSVLIECLDSDEPEVLVRLSGNGIPDCLNVSPAGDQKISGHPGGPFVPSKLNYKLTNTDATNTISWSAAKSVDWLNLSPAGGTLLPGKSATVQVRPNSLATTLPEGDYNDVVVFTNLTTTAKHGRNVTLKVYTTPKIWLDPPEGGFNVTVRQGGTFTETLTIGNSGDANLSFELSSMELPAQLLAASSPVALLETGEDKLVLEYSFAEPQLVSSIAQNYDLLKMEGLELYKQIGAPVIPVRPVEILIPYGKKVVNCQVTADETLDLPDSYILAPAQKPYPLNYKGVIVATPADPVIYGKATPWPSKYFEQVGTYSKRGYNLLVLNLFPLQYIPKEGKVSYAPNMLLEIELADEEAVRPVMPSGAVKADLAVSVDNSAALETYPASGEQGGSGAALALPPGGPYKYIVITSQALKDAPGPSNFQALCDAKTADGIPATIVTTEWIYANYDGTKPSGGSDNQTRIRNFLIDAYQNWGTEYVLLGGINAIVPSRLFWVDSLAWEVDYMPVDMYYGCVDPPACTFDYDADNMYGETTDGVGGGDVDLFAEIYVGRATVENATELANFIKKTLTYSLSEDEYISRIAMVGEWLGFGGVAEYATEAMEQIRTGGFFDDYYTCGFEDNNYPSFIDFNTIGCMPDDPCCCWPLYDAEGYDWPKERLICLMNGGIHCFNHLGHADYTYDMKLYTSDLPSLTNDDYFFVYSQGCMPGGFDTTNCFAEVITSMEHGAFAVIMNARFGWGEYETTDGPGQRYARRFWDAPLGEGLLEIGIANQDSKEENISNINNPCMRWTYYELNLFGDPAQKFRFAELCNWLFPAPDKGVVRPGDSMDVNVVFTPGNLELGTYYGEVIVKSNDAYTPRLAVPVTMTVVPGAFRVTPQDGLASKGVVGGPFDPASKTYTLINDSCEPMEWYAGVNAPWLNVEPNSGVIDPCSSQAVQVVINEVADGLDPCVYTGLVTFTQPTEAIVVNRIVTLKVVIRDFMTELFDAGDNDLDNLTLTLVPDGSAHFYTACVVPASEFPTDPAGGAVLSLDDDDYIEIIVGGGKLIPFYGQDYDTFYVGSNGYVTFDTGDIAPDETLENHFLYMRISALFDDLNPSAGGAVSWKQLADRVAVTYQDVPEYSLSNRNNFQIEMFFDGVIRITWLDIAAQDGLVGISDGAGLLSCFVESDLTRYGSCVPGDLDRDGNADYLDLLLFVQHWLSDGCTPADGYCDGLDSSRDGFINFDDYASLADGWL